MNKIAIPLEQWERGKANIKALLRDVPDFEGRAFDVIGKGTSRKGNPWLLVEIQEVDTPVVFAMGTLTAFDRLSAETSFPIFTKGEDVTVNTENIKNWLLSNDEGNASIALK